MGSRYGEYFTASIILNPVVNIPFSINITDIPEWNISTSLNGNKNWNLTPDDYKKMFEDSPMV